MFKVQPSSKVYREAGGHALKPHPTDLRSRESNPQPLVYKASGLSTTPQWLQSEVHFNIDSRHKEQTTFQDEDIVAGMRVTVAPTKSDSDVIVCLQ